MSSGWDSGRSSFTAGSFSSLKLVFSSYDVLGHPYYYEEVPEAEHFIMNRGLLTSQFRMFRRMPLELTQHWGRSN